MIERKVSFLIALFLGKLFQIDFSYVDEIYDAVKAQAVRRWVLLLPGGKCSWAQLSGGCYMCGLHCRSGKINRHKLPSRAKLMGVFRLGKVLVERSQPSQLTIYNGGNFLNDEEIPREVQEKICMEVNSSAYIESLFVESRPEFVTVEKVRSLKSLLGTKSLKVGIGLECVTDYYRKYYVHKGLTRSRFQRGVDILKENNVRVLVYVFLKPVHLGERESINEAIRTIEYAFSIGGDEVALESAFIQENTVMQDLYSRGEFRPPWLWSIIEVVTQVHHLLPVYIGGFKDEPAPLDVPRNCSKCSWNLVRVFEEYNRTLNVSLLKRRYCECLKDWEKDYVQNSRVSCVNG